MDYHKPASLNDIIVNDNITYDNKKIFVNNLLFAEIVHENDYYYLDFSNASVVVRKTFSPIYYGNTFASEAKALQAARKLVTFALAIYYTLV